MSRRSDDAGRTAALTSHRTTSEGRTVDWLVDPSDFEPGAYELIFHLGDYYRAASTWDEPPFFPEARVRFRVDAPLTPPPYPFARRALGIFRLSRQLIIGPPRLEIAMTDQAPATLDMIERFISFDTTSHKSNLPLIHYVRDYLADLGVSAVLTHDATGQKANLFATIGPTDRPGIVLSGHTDVVPVDGQDWSTDPFSLTKRDGKIYGRGVVDMKGFLAIATAFAPVFARRDLTTPIHLAMSFDEGSRLPGRASHARGPGIALVAADCLSCR